MTITTCPNTAAVPSQIPSTPVPSYRKHLGLCQSFAALQVCDPVARVATPVRLMRSLELQDFNDYRISPLTTGSFGAVAVITDNKTENSIVVKYSHNQYVHAKKNTEENKKLNEGYLTNENKMMRYLLEQASASNYIIQVGSLHYSSKTFGKASYYQPVPVFAMLKYEYDLFNYINRKVFFQNHLNNNFKETIGCIYQLLEAVKFIHSHNITHRDLKTENILFDQHDSRWKVCDFGLAENGLIDLQEKKGSLPTMAPEVLTQSYYDSKVDMWSLGCIFYEILTSSNMPDLYYKDDELDKPRSAALRKNKNPINLSRLPLETPYYLRQLIVNLLQKNPVTRMSAASACHYVELVLRDYLVKRGGNGAK